VAKIVLTLPYVCLCKVGGTDMMYDSSDCAVCFSLDTTQELKHPNIVQLYDYLVSVCDCHVTACRQADI